MAMGESGRRSEQTNRRGCIALAIAVTLFLLLLIAITSGWLGPVKNQKIPAATNVEENRL
jgi:hypothetical protein